MFQAPVTRETYYHISFFFSLSLSISFSSVVCTLKWLKEKDNSRNLGKGSILKCQSYLWGHPLCILFNSKAQGFSLTESFQLCRTPGNPMDCNPPVSVRGILQARVLEWIAMPSSRGSSQPRDWTAVFCISCIARRFFTHWASWEAQGLTQILSKRVLHQRGKPDLKVHALAL